MSYPQPIAALVTDQYGTETTLPAAPWHDSDSLVQDVLNWADESGEWSEEAIEVMRLRIVELHSATEAVVVTVFDFGALV